jgi:hypothetical protein
MLIARRKKKVAENEIGDEVVWRLGGDIGGLIEDFRGDSS